ncbi:hypothetical protein D1872_287880 [compost metagenome]
MIILRSAFRSEQEVNTVNFVQMRSFCQLDTGSFKDNLCFAHQLLLYRVKFLQSNSVERVISNTLIPNHIDKVLSAVLVVEQGGIKA